MKLSDLLMTSLEKDHSDIEINRIDVDSRQVEEGSLFIACKGLSTDGHLYLKSAEENGAVAAIVSRQVQDISIPQIVVSDPQALLAPLSRKLYRTGVDEVTYYAITGTDGKTTTSHMLRHIFQSSKQKAACIGTSGVFAQEQLTRIYLTTPQAPELHRLIRYLLNRGMEKIILETSSHALVQGRVDGVKFRYAIFTNFTPEHLDYHKTMEEYLNAKLILFKQLNKDTYAILNSDDLNVMRAARDCSAHIISYGINNQATYRAHHVVENSDNIDFQLRYQEADYPVRIPCLGSFNVYNALAAISAAHLSGIDLLRAIESMKSFYPINGRQEVIDLGQNYMVISDFAHTENAILSMLKWAHSLPHQKIRVLATAAANRDRSKRPRIGRTLDQYADQIILTSGIVDYENPTDILHEIINGIEKHNAELIVNRYDAIHHIIQCAGDGDIILILGIGDYQDLPIAGKRIYYNEAEAIKLAIAHRQMNDALIELPTSIE